MRVRGLIAAAFACVIAGCAQPPPETPDIVHVGPTPPPVVAVPVAKPEDTPRILDVWLSETQFRAGDVVRARVTTPTNIASVEVRVESLGRAMPRQTYGRFSGSVVVPRVPFFLHRRFSLRFIARTAGDQQARVTVPIVLR